jgi:hypothetical protein
MSDMFLRAALSIWARSKRADTEPPAGSVETTPLSASAGAALRHAQNANLVSRIYRLSGNGTLPIPAGKFELGKRGKQFDDV